MEAKEAKRAEKAEKNKKKNQKNKIYNIKYKNPSDVKLHYVLPIILAIGIVCFIFAGVMLTRNVTQYKKEVLQSSMAKGTSLPLWGGQTDAKLTLGNSVLSKDGKTLAVEVKYDDVAHNVLSSFGTKYRLRLVVTPDNKMNGVKMKYGLFGTDGSGVLTVHSDKGFENQAFIVMLVDRGYLVSTTDLTTDNVDYNSDELDKSITAQLSGADDEDEANDDSSNKLNSKKIPPIFYMRLNAHNAKRVGVNWENDRDVVKSLFVSDNLKDKEKQLAEKENQARRGKKTLAEMNQRLKENPDDTNAQEQKQELENSLAELDANVNGLKKRIETLKNSVIKKDVLDPQRDKYKRYPVDTLDID